MTNDTEAQKTAENQLITLFDTIYERNYNIFTIMSEQNDMKRKNKRSLEYIIMRWHGD